MIAPSLLSADFARLGEDCLRAEAAGADWHHVDVMDGHFVPNLTIGPAVVRALARVLTLPLDVHLMITDPWTYGPKFLEAGAAGIGFHAELLVDDLARSDARTLLAEVERQGARRCIAINPATPVDVVRPWLDDLDMVLVMSVVPGFGGQAFMPDVLDKVRTLRDEYRFEGDIQMDGGISRETIGLCAEAGCNVFVAGSALYGASCMETEIDEFRRVVAEVAA
ncbi:MAG: ribulose-phosphate 3-epimerase [Planctomycetes bacterium]|nr:ribulose-phosphate 3-epimerase [Planctomycetota bacterium]MCB9890349.1 ribulose-phosphate 3-epimerase [Planctomycetota bacterium]MCB9918167.1 ribulose-phosphate 3-epimerase [Planctomycetota bacterium]